MNETRIITAALPFVNNIPHLGNVIGSHLPADIFARYCRLKGYRTIFVGGTDEHGTAIEFAAQMKKITPKKLCDSLYKEHKEIYEWFEISYDNFSRTSKKIHHELVKEFFLKLYKNGYITEKEIKIAYCTSCKRGLADRYITGRCPHCEYEQAKGDQCEKCATLINPIELIEPYCSVCKSKKIEFRDTKHLFLDLRKLAKKIEKWNKDNKNLRMQVKNLALGWLKQGLKERCITRDLSWGVQVPLKGYEDKVFYVWFDNVIGYISSTVELLGKEGHQLWKNKKVKTYYFIGKDNIPFHTIFWPGQIMAEGSYVLPYNVVGLQYLNFEGQKFSKSKSIGIFSDQVIKSGVPLDYWRFYLNSVLPETKDSDFSLQDFIDRINKELIGNFGNFFHRTLDFTWKKFDGKLAEIKTVDKRLEKEISEKIKKVEELYESCNLREALTTILHLSDLGNQYFNNKEPWKTKDQDALNYCYEMARIISLLLTPIIPNSVEKAFKILNTKDKKLKINRAKKTIKEPKILFKKLEEKDLELFQQKQFPIQIKVGKIIGVKNHPDAEKLYLLKVDFGKEKRQVVAGLKKYFSAKELLNRVTVFCTNLKKAKLRGENSEAMILIADEGKKLTLLDVESKVGAEIKFTGMDSSDKEITFDTFNKSKMTIKNGQVTFKNHLLEKVSVKNVKDNTKIS